MRFIVVALALAAVSAPVIAADQPTAVDVVAHPGDMLRDANNVRLGSVNTIAKDGSVGIIYNSRFVTVPAATLSVVNGKLTTKLTKSDVSAL